MKFFSLLGGSDKTHRGVIPNKAKAEEFATKQFNAAKKEHHDILETNQKAFGGLASSWHEWR